MASNVYFVDASELTVTPLSPAEKLWVSKLAKVLGDCPTRLELITHGDRPDIVDAEGAKRSELYDGTASADGVVLASINCGPIVHGVS